MTVQDAHPVDVAPPPVKPESMRGERNQNPPGLGLWALLREDRLTHDGGWLEQGFWAVAVHRFGNWRMGVRPRFLRVPLSIVYKVLEKWIQVTCGISLAYTVKVGRRVRIWHFGGMILGARMIGNDVHIRQNTTFGVARRGDSRSLKPVIEDRVDIGAGAVIAGAITIGHDSVIGANAVVLKDVPPYSVAVGIPAKVIKTLRPDEVHAALTPEAAAGDAPSVPPPVPVTPSPAAAPAAAPATGPATPWDANGQSANGEAASSASAPPPAATTPSADRAELLAKARDVEF